SIQVSDLQAKFDQTSINSQITVKNIAQPAIKLNMEVDKLNLDRYMPPKGDKEKSGSDKKRPALKDKNTGLPFETLRKLNIQGQIKVKELTAKNIRLNNLQLDLTANNGLLEINPVKANLYEGSLYTTTRLDLRHKTPRIRVNKELSQVKLQPLLKDVAEIGYLTGAVNIDANMATTGTTPKDWLRHVNGDLSLFMDGGTIQGLNIPRLIGNKIRAIKGKNPKTSETKDTNFSQLKVSAKLQNGIAQESKVSLISPLLRLNGSGSIDLVKQDINYSLQAELTKEFKEKSGIELDKKGAITIPIQLSGSLTDPNYTINIMNLIQELGRKEIKDQAQKHILDKLGHDSNKDQKSEKIDPGQMIKGLFKNK
ncbi:MAG TPA: AsmA family protein, partial [Desulfohalobiaceae bacterium]|nr:AsmA family protein [Desulfohalobiaceae bacterium]